MGELALRVSRIQRFEARSAIAAQARIWTLLTFEADDSMVTELSNQLSRVLDEPGWYVDMRTTDETLIIFPHLVFRYRRGDAEGRRAAENYGRQHGVPDAQLDWPA
ncbi:hypothetical protein Ae706Ps2_3570c [Pseudonocardia sp. Ae706_Ps2]|nr:hypothetical protein Ae331Ps2_2355 [Pseudonocardia sp. Ae331_Ps2]OLM12273.1 hypothetical protein Ae505Ps2_2401c [Pseudonocardia sp. Ae505_Ps2]OLM25137.1 hypothetical protein Ae706Ps2_3570c [Pseudonocardia sp. Ae706_Ps2]